MSNEKIYCSECGTPNEADAAFCESCGHKLEAPAIAPDAAHEATAPRSRRFSPKLLGLLALLIAAGAGAMTFRGQIASFVSSRGDAATAPPADSVVLAPSPQNPQLADTAGAGHIAIAEVPDPSVERVFQIPPGAASGTVMRPPAVETRRQTPQPVDTRRQSPQAESGVPNLPQGVASFPDDFKPPAPASVTRMPVTTGNPSSPGPTTTTDHGAAASSAGRINAGAAISLRASAQICTDKTREGATFSGIVQQDVEGSNGARIPKGTQVTFVVERLQRPADKPIEFSVATQSIQLNGETQPISATVDALTVKPKGRSLLGALAGAATAAAVTRAAGGDTKQTVAGGVVGGAAGAAIGSQIKTGDGCIEKNSPIRITLRESLTL